MNDPPDVHTGVSEQDIKIHVICNEHNDYETISLSEKKNSRIKNL